MEADPLATNNSHTRITELLANAKAIMLSEPHKALMLTDQAIELATNTGDPHFRKELARGFSLRGSLQSELSDYSAAVKSVSQALDIFQALDDKEKIATALDEIGVILGIQALYPDSLQYFLKAENVITQWCSQTSDLAWYALLLNNIGMTYVNMDQPEKALPYLRKSVELSQKSGNMAFLSNGLDSLAMAYLQMSDVDKALTSALESVECARKAETTNVVAENLLTVFSAYVQRGEYTQAIEYIQESLVIAQSHGYRRTEAEALRKLGDLYQRQEKNDEALEIVKQALSVAQSIGVKRLVYQCLYDLAMICKGMGDYAIALDYFEQFHVVKSEIFSEQADWRIKNLEITHQIEQNRKENEMYQQANIVLKKEIVARKESQALAEKLAITDPLTGLYNRRYLFDLAKREIERALRHNNPVALAIIDLDHFKLINDTYGHPVGDMVLSITAGIIRKCTRAGDVVCRYGGEEFAILMPQTNFEQGKLTIERIRKKLFTQTIKTDPGTVSVTFSAGIALCSASESYHAKDLETLLKQADKALYDAKQSGRNRTAIYSS